MELTRLDQSDTAGLRAAADPGDGSEAADPQTPDPQTPDPQTPDTQTPDPQTPDPQTPDPQTVARADRRDRLPPAYADALRLADAQVSPAAMAAELGVPEESLETLLQLARAKLAGLEQRQRN